MILSDKTNYVCRSVWKIEGRWLYHTLTSYDGKREREHSWWIPYLISYPILITIGIAMFVIRVI